MVLNSIIECEAGDDCVLLRTHDEAKILVLHRAPASPYSDNLTFELEAGSPTVRGKGPFQISVEQVTRFIDEYEEVSKAELQDVNGDGTITFDKIDLIGHVRVTIQLGGPWSNQARIAFDTDQTALTSFAEDLRSFLE
ncbi:hypothetical protein G7067_11765 [Leucobacter insecticola]|uniref:Uncharacterized protein n=1 Tax=Leucobacter insecticola TaxID=2714934 RepID=A0A6G8FLG2_9MICO|nr:hypothetical protein [Leucobacter insecticola]QIM16922.1 hypothetical protein G7067_11765 [Leucobacter insecticola]